MNNVFNQFQTNIEEIKKTHLITKSLHLPNPSIIDTSNVLRSCIVLTVSALDHLIHELTIVGMKEIFNGIRPTTPRYDKQQISLAFFHGISHSPPLISFETELREKLGWQTFQRPNKIKEAISLFHPVQLWQQIAIVLGDSETNIKNQLNLIIDRRNMIAHEADIEPIYKTKRNITDYDVEVSIEFIEKLGDCIYNLVK
ncbi:HEPN domain-containing protein [Aequorivita todarodis]|uniref:HEPN domain-containing protein n=1 Tax=Flavobacteriaceae TaxID=49546 RepID=UPI0023500DF0|nr:HEPN domain-containing protein [Aequorivita todarodis]MDC8001389.1 HEPN domain-containing protein [Aequorivita todarodis]